MVGDTAACEEFSEKWEGEYLLLVIDIIALTSPEVRLELNDEDIAFVGVLDALGDDLADLDDLAENGDILPGDGSDIEESQCGPFCSACKSRHEEGRGATGLLGFGCEKHIF